MATTEEILAAIQTANAFIAEIKSDVGILLDLVNAENPDLEAIKAAVDEMNNSLADVADDFTPA